MSLLLELLFWFEVFWVSDMTWVISFSFHQFMITFLLMKNWVNFFELCFFLLHNALLTSLPDGFLLIQSAKKSNPTKIIITSSLSRFILDAFISLKYDYLASHLGFSCILSYSAQLCSALFCLALSQFTSFTPFD